MIYVTMFLTKVSVQKDFISLDTVELAEMTDAAQWNLRNKNGSIVTHK